MKQITILIIAIFCIATAAPALAIDTGYTQSGYYESFVLMHQELEKTKNDGRVVQSRDGKQAAVIPQAQKEQPVEQQSIKEGDVNKVSR